MLEVSVLMVSFNTRELTLEAIRALIDSTMTDFELIVVDNASVDGSADAIARAYPGVRLIRSPANLGFGVANNLAAESAVGRYLLLLNPDTRVLRGTVENLIAFAKRHPTARVWGGRTLNGDGSLNPGSCWRSLSLWTLLCSATGLAAAFPRSAWLNPEAYGGWKRDDVRRVDIVSGCFLLMEREFWNELGGFDPAFFMYGEDADLCIRARRLGAMPMITPDAEIVHYAGASEPVREDKIVRLYRAKVQLMRRHWSPLGCFCGRLLMQANVVRRRIIFRFRAGTGGDQDSRANPFSQVWLRRSDWLNPV